MRHHHRGGDAAYRFLGGDELGAGLREHSASDQRISDLDLRQSGGYFPDYQFAPASGGDIY